jgi:pSer/pThr/pTyr-binding forkhead associated (FHA) protein
MWYLVDLVTNKSNSLDYLNFLLRIFYNLFKNIETPYFLSNRTYKIGRLNAVDNKNAPLNDIQIASDSTVSRSHAEILIKFDEKNCDDIEYKANIVLTDNSRFGTFVNDIKVEGFTTLKKDDIIKFGVNNTCFK